MKSNSAAQMKTSSETATDLSGDAVVQISDALRKLLADTFALYLKTKKFHWHMSGKHFRDYHLLLYERATQIFAMTDGSPSEPARSAAGHFARSATSPGIRALKITMRNSSHPRDMLLELRSDGQLSESRNLI
jgi:starvation-inducible DNA-binding protein